MIKEDVKLKRLSQAIEEDMTENELFEIARERRYRINDLQKENAELKKQGKIREEIIIGEQQEIEELKAQVEQLQQAYTITVDKSVIREQELEAQIAQLSNDNHVLKTSFITQQEQIEKTKLESDEHLKTVHKQLESLLKYAKDKGIIKSWFYNGSYSWEPAECQYSINL